MESRRSLGVKMEEGGVWAESNSYPAILGIMEEGEAWVKNGGRRNLGKEEGERMGGTLTYVVGGSIHWFHEGVRVVMATDCVQYLLGSHHPRLETTPKLLNQNGTPPTLK